ncbi:MAG: MtnX-like HAD-IB family phosphatase [Candidatus Riflebacteria bacterium]|nr:MtnX-like HAD-IB family phosphatase [Candidatus Riflebacteria bacterium]
MLNEKINDLIVISDFDGTISLIDITDLILTRFGHPSWHEIEKEWEDGKISSKECMQRQISLISSTPEEMISLINEVPLDPHFLNFSTKCREMKIPIMILSDGLDFAIHHALKKYGISGIPIISNQLDYLGNKRFSLSFPNFSNDCQVSSGVCKCHVANNFKAQSSRSTLVFFGDGRSDFCLSQKADLVFARSSLLTYCKQKEICHLPCENFESAFSSLERYFSFPNAVSKKS